MNQKIKSYAREKGVKLWQVADELKITDGQLSRKEKQDPFLLDKLYEERAGIVYKLVMALKNLIATDTDSRNRKVSLMQGRNTIPRIRRSYPSGKNA